MPEKVDLFGCDLAPLTMDETVGEVRRIVAAGQPSQHIVLNALKVVMMQDDPKLAEIVRGCSLISADGQSVVWASRFLGRPVPERVAGIDLMNRLIAEAEREGWRVFFLGAKPDVLSRFSERMRGRHPNLKIAGTRDGYFAEHEEPQVAAEIAAAAPDLLFVGISSPKKEFFLSRNLERMRIPLAMGVGGAFDVEAGVVRRAPVWMQKSGLEWLYRFIQEPRRMWHRVVVGNSRFVMLTLKERSAQRRRAAH